MRADSFYLPSAAALYVGLVLLGPTAPGVAAQPAVQVTARTGEIELPTYPWAAVKHPYFRGTDAVNIYPYPMLDFLSREKTNRTYSTVILENEYLRITFLPELGGKIHEVIDKTTGQPMFYVNHVVKPGLIGQCGAWTSGGVEWNTGPQGHTVSCLQPVAVEILPPNQDGSRSVAVGETERIYGTRWTVVVTLRPGRSFIEERIRIYNPTETIRPYYFWNCTAVPNTAGFRFIYPMTLGCDHAGEKFFQWPVDHGKDLSRGANYQDASSIFAWHCDQDFFGSYNDDLGRGVVAYANHYQLPGKKAWTWGHGGFGKMHQMDLTDDDGPYNEVQTGPLLTQAQVGRLAPCQAVEWNEWWYPVHGIGAFTFANKNLAANAEVARGKLHLRILGSGTWRTRVRVGRGAEAIGEAECDLHPNTPAEIELALPDPESPFQIGVNSAQDTLAAWEVPPALPARQPPQKRTAPQTASELVQSAWQEYLFARFSESQARFTRALENDPKCRDAHTGLAYLFLERDWSRVAQEARQALASDPDHGLAHYALAVAEYRRGEEDVALDEAWQATLDPATAVAGRALVGKLLVRQHRLESAVDALSASGPWQGDPLCRNYLALALREMGEQARANSLAQQNLTLDPRDNFARSLLWLDASTRKGNDTALNPDAHALLELCATYAGIGREEIVSLLLDEFYVPPPGGMRRGRIGRNPLLDFWYLELSNPRQFGQNALSRAFGESNSVTAGEAALDWPWEYETLAVLERAVKSEPHDGQAALYLGHLLFHLGRYQEGRQMWQRVAELRVEPVLACRALGMAAKTLDGDLKGAYEWLVKANQDDPKDAVVARDLANVLFARADKPGLDPEKNQFLAAARDCLKTAFDSGKGRSDFVALLARAQNRLGEFAATARMLEQVRVTVWEGAHEVRDLFEQAHLALGEAQLKAGHPADALAEFNRALEYPANLATGKLENAREAHIHFQRGNALAALGRKPEAMAAWKLAANEPQSEDSRIEEARQKAKQALLRY